MKKGNIKKIDSSKRNFLTGSVTLAGVAAATSVLPISIANANHKDSSPKGLPSFISWKDRSALIVHSDNASALSELREEISRDILLRYEHKTLTSIESKLFSLSFPKAFHEGMWLRDR